MTICIPNNGILRVEAYLWIFNSGYVDVAKTIADVFNEAFEPEVKKELQEANIPYKDVEEGIMIETPAAAMISDELAKMVDFFSIGTNDLTQYTLAIDRQNEKLNVFYNPHHKAILKFIQLVVDNAHKEGKWVGICGELGADTRLTETFIKMGVDELSVAPGAVLKVRNVIRQIE